MRNYTVELKFADAYMYTVRSVNTVRIQCIHSVSNRAELDALTRQKKFELEEFKTLHQEFQEQETPSAIYCLSSSWFKVWEGFVTGRKREVGGHVVYCIP